MVSVNFVVEIPTTTPPEENDDNEAFSIWDNSEIYFEA
jgi:hypothetical protein